MSRVGKTTKCNDYLSMDNYSTSELKEAISFYSDLLKVDGITINGEVFSEHFKCSPLKGRVLYEAAKFYRDMKRKGLA